MHSFFKALLVLSIFTISACSKQSDFGKIPEEESDGASASGPVLDMTSSDLQSCDPLNSDAECPNPDPTPSGTPTPTPSGSPTPTPSPTGTSGGGGGGGGNSCDVNTDQIIIFVSSVEVRTQPANKVLTYNINRNIDLVKLSKNIIAELQIPIPAGTKIKEIQLNSVKDVVKVMRGCEQICPRGAKLPPGKYMIHYQGNFLTYNSGMVLKTDLGKISRNCGKDHCTIIPSNKLLQ